MLLISYIPPIYPKNTLVLWSKSKTLWLYGLKNLWSKNSIAYTSPSILKNPSILK